jgi:hypothetical protein
MYRILKRGDSEVMLLNWIVKKDGSDCALEQLTTRYTSLINFITCYHSELLKALGVKADRVRIQNEALMKWLFAEIFNPPTGFPIVGRITKQTHDLTLRALDAYLSKYFVLPEAEYSPSKVACMIISWWYRLRKNSNYHINTMESLLKEIQNGSLVTNP